MLYWKIRRRRTSRQYLGKGQYFGEMAPMGDRRRNATAAAPDRPPGPRTHADDFERILAHSGDFGDRLKQIMTERQKQLDSRNATRWEAAAHEHPANQDSP
jgi:CRP-like cAMP-binding protein